MRLRTSLVAGEIVTPASLALPGLGFGENPGRSPELPYELTFQLADLGPGFLALFDDWCEELRTSPDPDDELAALLVELDWPRLPELADRDPGALAAVLLVLGEDVLTDLERGRDVAVAVRYAPNSVDEVELCGASITLRGRAFWVQS